MLEDEVDIEFGQSVASCNFRAGQGAYVELDESEGDNAGEKVVVVDLEVEGVMWMCSNCAAGINPTMSADQCEGSASKDRN